MRTLKISLLVFILSISISAQWYQQNSGNSQALYGLDFTDSLNGTAVGGTGIIIRTTNGGDDWLTQISGTTNDLLGVSFIDEYNGFAVGTYGTILKTTNGGQNWLELTSGTNYTFLGIQMLNENVAVAVGYFGTILKTVDGGQTWIPKSSGTGKHINNISFVDVNNGIAVGGTTQGGIILKTTDGGETWMTKLEGMPEELFGVSFVDINNCSVVGGYWTLYFRTKIILRTFDGGDNWNVQLFETVNPLRGVSCTDSINGSAVGEYGVVFRTTNAGLSWINQPSSTDNTLIAVSFTDANHGWAVGWNGTVLHTNNGGTPVELISFTATLDVNKIILNWSTATETNNSGFEILRKTQNDSEEWNKICFVPGHGTTTETQNYSFTDNDVKPGKYQYKLKQIDYDGTFEYSQIVEVEIPFANRFSLQQNYPNPFNPVTKIKYSFPAVETRHASSLQLVTLKVYDILGREVTTLVNEEKSAGDYEVEFNAATLPTGIYFYQLKAGQFSKTRKMVLLR
ncbi:MAG: T9SS type A sorting domain-containing protein [bacterium]|nr:T9SS type A sorting domain-containing protein [bacterium]